jgi:sulfate permease, SulP family
VDESASPPPRKPLPGQKLATGTLAAAKAQAEKSSFRPALLDSLKGYRFGDFTHDLTAGLVVAAVAIPLAIAFAIASLPASADGTPAPSNAPQVGLVTVVVAGLVAALFGGSRYLVTGPTGAFIVILAGIVHDHGVDGLLVATLLAGVMLLLAGIFRLGAVIKYIPYPVTTGFTAGIAVVIFLGQLPDLFGVTLSHSPPEAPEKAWETLKEVAAGHTTWAAFGIAAGTIVVIQLVKRFVPRVPGPIVALVLATALVALLAPSLSALQEVPTVGNRYTIPNSLPAPQVPEGLLSWAKVKEMLPSAFTIFFLGALESLLAAVVADGMVSGDPNRGSRKRHDSNQELMGQGLANIASPLFGGIAATGAIARTATNIQNGGRTPLASLIHVGIVLAVLYLLSPMAALVPMPALAGILAVVAWNMSERHHFRKVLRMPRQDAGVMLATFLITVFIDLTWAVAVGLLLAAAIFLHRMSAMTRVGRLEGPAAAPLFRPEDVPPGVLVYSIDGPFFFGAADQFQETLASVADPPKVVVLRMRDVPYLDATGLHALESAIRGLQRRGTRVMVSAIQSQPLDMMERSGAVHVIGDGNLFKDTPTALDAARAHLAPSS